MTELGGTRALVTGATSGLGLAMARTRARAWPPSATTSYVEPTAGVHHARGTLGPCEGARVTGAPPIKFADFARRTAQAWT